MLTLSSNLPKSSLLNYGLILAWIILGVALTLSCSQILEQKDSPSPPQAATDQSQEQQDATENNELPKPAPIVEELAEHACTEEACAQLTACQTAGTSLSAPGSIEEARLFFNQLPKPVSVSCVMAALPRPLKVSATSNALSAQGATSEKSPRVFILVGTSLVLSFVPEGDGSNAIELAESYDVTRSIKGDLKFPLTTEFAESDPYKGLMITATFPACAQVCHGYQMQTIHDYGNNILKYASDKLYPDPSMEVSVAKMQAYHLECRSSSLLRKSNADRCSLYAAMFEYGEVVEQKLKGSY